MFFINSCKKPTETENKIQKNSTFEPFCESKSIISSHCCDSLIDVRCEHKGYPVCGTEPGSGRIEVHCIDINDIILKNTRPECDGRLTCKEISTEKLEVTTKIQKNSNFQATCTNLGSKSDVKCTEGTPACGTKPGSATISVYCIDLNDNILSLWYVKCDDENSFATCEPVQ